MRALTHPSLAMPADGGGKFKALAQAVPTVHRFATNIYLQSLQPNL